MIEPKPTKPCPDCGGMGFRHEETKGRTKVSVCPKCEGAARVDVTEAELEAEGQLRII